MRLRWTRPALRDLDTIGRYLASHDPKAASRIILRVRDSCQQLTAHPESGRAGRVPGTRELVVNGTPYIVPYRVRESDVELLAVFHGARRWPEEF
ncbi:MAG: type II toxin-antitoxin system RelE/ParE family toxin [Beijerinckiaceae bacterium]